MADRITQELGIDAAQALQTLNALNTGFQNFEARLESVARRMQLFNREGGKQVAALKQVAQNTNAANRAANKYASTATNSGRAASAAASRANAQVKQLTISYETLVRVVATQAIVRALSVFRNELRQAVTDAFELQTAIREIGTIDPRVTENLAAGLPTGGAVDAIAGEVRALSDAFGIPQLQVAESLYQAISNQIATTGDASQRAADQVEFLDTALRFARAAVVDAESATNLLAGVINSFALNIEEADIIAAKFFKTIELGRTTGRELARSFGGVDNIAEKLGVTFDELSAAFATITIQGIDTAKAATQLRGIFNAFLKPTTAMTKALEQLGVENGQQLVELRGLQGALQDVISTTDGAADSISELFPRIRGLTGILALSSEQGAAKFTQNLDEIQNTAEDLLAQKFEFTIDSDAFRVEQDLQKLRNFLIDDFGNSFIEVTRRVTDTVGGIDTFIGTIDSMLDAGKVAVPILGAVAVGISGIGFATKIAARDVSLLSRSISILAAGTLAVGAGSFIGNTIRQRLEAENQAIREASEERLKFLRDRAAAEVTIEETKNNRIIKAANNMIAAQRRLNAGFAVEAQRAADSFANSFTTAIQDVVDVSDSQLSKISAAIRRNISELEAAPENIRDAQRALQDLEFEFGQRDARSDEERVSNLQQRALERQREAVQLLARARQDQTVSIEEVRNAFREATSAAREFDQLAQQTDTGQDDVRARRSVLDAARAQVRLEQQIPAILEQRNDRLEQGAEDTKRNREELQGLADEAQRLTQALAERKVPAGFQNLDQVRARVDEIRRSTLLLIKDQQQISGDLFAGVSEQFAFNLREALSNTEIDAFVITESALKKLNDDLSRSIQVIITDANIRTTLENLGLPTSFASAEEAQEFFKALVGAQNRLVSINSELNEANQELENARRSAAAIQVGDGSIFGGEIGPAVELAQSVVRDFQQRLESGQPITNALLNDFKAATAAVQQQVQAAEQSGFGLGSLFTSAAVSTTLDDLRTLEGILNQAVIAQNKWNEAQRKQAQFIRQRDAGQFPLQQFNQTQIDALQEAARQFLLNLNQTSTEVENVNNKFSQGRTLQQQQISAQNQLTAAVRQTNSELARSVGLRSASTGQPIGAMFGKGIKYFQAGGNARGVDTVPAMLKKGEFVVNDRSAGRFFSQLQAINAGQTPTFRQDGGPVTNVGDINVSIKTNDASKIDGRQIGRDIQREMRRGTLKK